MEQQFAPGQRALVVGRHPHAGTFVTLVSFGPYGLAILALEGWLARADDGQQFYCQLAELAGLAEDDDQALVPAPDDQALVVQVEELPADAGLEPTISPSKRETTLDKLRAYYRASEDVPVLLTRHQQQVLKRLEAAWGLLLDAKTSEKAAKKLMENFKISRPQAYRDLRDCKQLFGDVVESSRKADRYLLKEMGLETYGKAKKAGELGEMNKALSNLIKITGIEKADPNIPDAEAFEASNYVLEVKGREGNGLTLNLETIAALPAHQWSEVLDIVQNSGASDEEMLHKILEAARGTD